jgi:hypothetical protein
MLGIELRASRMLRKYSTTKLNLQLCHLVFKEVREVQDY